MTLHVDNLTVTYGRGKRRVPAVRGVSFDVDSGQTLGLAGESGCGKSSVAAALLRVLPESATTTGQVLLNGEDVLTMKPGRLRVVRWAEMAIVFQGALHVMNPVQTVGRQVDEALVLHEPAMSRSARQIRIVELFEQVGLTAGRLHAFPHQLSGGQRQRVMIAMALSCRPQVLVADEPTTALDVMVQAQILDLLSRLQRQMGMSMIFITHDLAVLGSICERLAIMYAGQIVESGPTAQVLADPQHPYTQSLLSAFPTVGAATDRFAPRGLAGDPPDPNDLPAGCSFNPRCPVAVDRCRIESPALVTMHQRQVACVHVAGSEELK